MRRLFALILIALLLGVGIVAVIETDPGYVLIAYGNYTVETSLWVGILVLALFTLGVYLILRLFRRLLGGQESLAGWIGGRRARPSSKLTTRGLIRFIEKQGGEVLTTPYASIVRMVARPYLRKWLIEGEYLGVLSSTAYLMVLKQKEKRYFRYFNRSLGESYPHYSDAAEKILAP